MNAANGIYASIYKFFIKKSGPVHVVFLIFLIIYMIRVTYYVYILIVLAYEYSVAYLICNNQRCC